MARPQGSGDTRERMLEVAETRFAQKGYDGAHLESIASEVGVRKTALYYYFDSKEELYIAVLERMLLEFERAIADALERRESPQEQALHLADAINDLLGSRPNYSQILIRIFVDRVPIDHTRLAPIVARLIQGVLAFHQRGIEQGAFRRLSSRHFFNSVLGMAAFYYGGGSACAQLMGVEDIFSPEAVAWRRKEFRRMLLGALLENPPSDPAAV